MKKVYEIAIENPGCDYVVVWIATKLPLDAFQPTMEGNVRWVTDREYADQLPSGIDLVIDVDEEESWK